MPALLRGKPIGFGHPGGQKRLKYSANEGGVRCEAYLDVISFASTMEAAGAGLKIQYWQQCVGSSPSAGN